LARARCRRADHRRGPRRQGNCVPFFLFFLFPFFLFFLFRRTRRPDSGPCAPSPLKECWKHHRPPRHFPSDNRMTRLFFFFSDTAALSVRRLLVAEPANAAIRPIHVTSSRGTCIRWDAADHRQKVTAFSRPRTPFTPGHATGSPELRRRDQPLTFRGIDALGRARPAPLCADRLDDDQRRSAEPQRPASSAPITQLSSTCLICRIAVRGPVFPRGDAARGRVIKPSIGPRGQDALVLKGPGLGRGVPCGGRQRPCGPPANVPSTVARRAPRDPPDFGPGPTAARRRAILRALPSSVAGKKKTSHCFPGLGA